MTEKPAENIKADTSIRQKITDVFYINGALNKKALVVLLFVLMLLLLAVILGIHSASKATASNIAGSYVLESVEGSGGGITSGDVDEMKKLGLEITLEVHDNGTAIMDVFGQTTNISYDINKMTMNIDGQKASFKYKRRKLTIKQNGSEMVFRK